MVAIGTLKAGVACGKHLAPSPALGWRPRQGKTGPQIFRHVGGELETERDYYYCTDLRWLASDLYAATGCWRFLVPALPWHSARH